MKAHYRAFGGRLVIEVEADTVASLFQQISPISEVLDADQCCGKCGSNVIYPRARVAQGFNFYELVCGDSACGARLAFGQHKVGGTLFPKREDDHGNKMDHNGWKVYLGIAAPQDAPQQRQQAQPPPRTGQRSASNSPVGNYKRTPPAPAATTTSEATVEIGPELKALLQRAALNQANREKVEVELCDRLRVLVPNDPAAAEALVQECWRAATDPFVDDDDTMCRLFTLVKEKEGKK